MLCSLRVFLRTADSTIPDVSGISVSQTFANAFVKDPPERVGNILRRSLELVDDGGGRQHASLIFGSFDLSEDALTAR